MGLVRVKYGEQGTTLVPRSRRQWGSVRRFRSGRWTASYLDPDTNQRASAPETFPTKAAADRWLARKRVDIDRGAAVDERAGAVPLREWWPGYAATIMRLKRSTVASYETAWRLRIEPAFGAMPVRRIKPSHVDAWVARMSSEGVSASKVIEAVGVLRRVLDRAVRDQVISANPCSARAAPLPRRPQMHRPVLSPAEVERLATAMKRADDALLVRLLAYGGLRIGEAFALRWDDVGPRTITIRESVSEAGGTITVGPTKSYAVRTVALPASLLAALAERRATGLVFPNARGQHRRYRVFRRDSWNPAADAADLKVTPHDLRATCASLLIDAGASVKDVQSQLGHADVTTTLALYARVRPGRSEDLASRLDALIAER